MANGYEAHTWVDNELVTKDKLNTMEAGIANAPHSATGSSGNTIFYFDLPSITVPRGTTFPDSKTNTAGSGGIYFRDSAGNYIARLMVQVTSTTILADISPCVQTSDTAVHQSRSFGVVFDRSTGMFGFYNPTSVFNDLITNGLDSTNIANLKSKLGIS